ncbi:hypothetical protein NNJEOMEG_02338 [Fundidesulfovibrio magnetotacticus]|uniref:DUF3431 domain-containing protein n=1 Tax=Fundidesulfovibrio magnetotacticus TaxID=2730080 RepID=A0A6V8LPL1_9BACT|nr:DUF3431 domain-containing protein [Fundidesulfovibrio magnetotacticus]GFK94492.1 hypothetical protein NNJEOMEG_02338 [Fundidesulfovibrio magnetotacticus]
MEPILNKPEGQMRGPGQREHALEPPSVELVIARYREDVSWLADMGLPATVYDKSGDPTPPETFGAVWTPLPNVGRESHTYLTHILARYPDFPDFTAFLQGDPFKHLSADGEADAAALKAAIERNVRLGSAFTGFAWFKLKCDRLGRPHAMDTPEARDRWKGRSRDIPVGAVYAELFAGDVPETFLATAPAGLLFVSKERILSRSKRFYKRCLQLILDDPDDARNTGHAFERLWQVIFNAKTPSRQGIDP